MPRRHGAPGSRTLDAFYAWWQSKLPELDAEWQAFKRARNERKRDG